MLIFPLGVVLSVTHEKLLCEVGELYKILNYMTGADLFTHQLPRARNAAAPLILNTHPELKEVDLSHINENNWKEELKKLEEKFGNAYMIPRLLDYEKKDPITELIEMGVPEEKIIPVIVDNE